MIKITFFKYNLIFNLIVNIEVVLHRLSLITVTKHTSKKPHKKVQIIVELGRYSVQNLKIIILTKDVVIRQINMVIFYKRV